MTDEASFYPIPSSFRGGVVVHPDDLPRFVVTDRLELQTFGPSVAQSSAAAFWDALDYAGSVGTLTVANTWTTIVDITGAGFLGNVVASHGSTTAAKTIGIRIERDGAAAWEWEETITTSLNQGTLVLGAMAGESDDAGRFPDAMRTLESADDTHQNGPKLMQTSYLHSLGLPVLAFEESLKVSVKNSSVLTASQGDKAAVTFVLR